MEEKKELLRKFFSKIKIKHIIASAFLLIYLIAVFSYTFIPRGNVNNFFSTKFLIAQIYSFPFLFGLFLSLISVIAILLCLYKKRKVAFIFALIFLIISLTFMFTDINNRKNTVIKNQDIEKQIKFVEWNAANNVDVKNIEKIFKEYDADIVVFPELAGYQKGEESDNRLNDLFIKAKINFNDYQCFTSKETAGNIAPVTVVTKKSFSKYKIKDHKLKTRFGTLYLESIDGNSPDIVGLHTCPPLPRLMFFWERDLKVVYKHIIKDNPNAIISGDFNATMRHGDLSRIDTHEDAMLYESFNNRGTWINRIPKTFRTSIDHVLIPKNKYSVTSIKTLNFSNSDHCAIFADLVKIKDK